MKVIGMMVIKYILLFCVLSFFLNSCISKKITPKIYQNKTIIYQPKFLEINSNVIIRTNKDIYSIFDELDDSVEHVTFLLHVEDSCLILKNIIIRDLYYKEKGSLMFDSIFKEIKANWINNLVFDCSKNYSINNYKTNKFPLVIQLFTYRKVYEDKFRISRDTTFILANTEATILKNKKNIRLITKTHTLQAKAIPDVYFKHLNKIYLELRNK